MRILNCLVGTAVLASSTVAAPPGEGKTPQFLNAARHPGADPHVIWDAASHQYYAYSTEGADPGYHFAIYSSPDLATWHRHKGGVLRACYDDDMNRLPGGQACWARDWYWAPETYHNEQTGWYFFFFAGRMAEDLTADNFRYSEFEEPSKIGVAVSKSPTGPFEEVEDKPIDYWPFDPNYHDVNLIMDKDQMLPPQSREEGQTAPMGTYIPTIDVNIFFDEDDRVYLYLSRNAYRNWNWDDELGKYIEESNIIVVEMDRAWWDDPTASTMPEIIASQKDIHAHDAPGLPCNITSYNGTGALGAPPRKDGWQTVISYGADPQAWENYHVNDYEAFNGTKKDRRWSEGSTLLKRPGQDGQPIYIILYSANNYEASNYGVGYAMAKSPLGPFVKATSNPILSQDPDAAIPIYSTGHGSVVASPPKDKDEHVGAQDVNLRTPKGAELFYVHHGRNDTTVARSLYTTRMTLDEKSVRFGSNDLINTHLTSQDQDLPKGTYPLRMEASCSQKGQGSVVTVRVTSKAGATFDLTEGSNRVVGLPGDVEATTVTAEGGSFELDFGQADVKDVAYQRLSGDGSWVTVIQRKAGCKK